MLPRLATQLDEIVVERWRSHVEVVLGFAGVEVDEPTRAKLLASDPFSSPTDGADILSGRDIHNYVRVGGFGELLRQSDAEAAVAHCLKDYWIETEHQCAQTDHAPTRWSTFWRFVDQHLTPPPRSIAAVAAIENELAHQRTDLTRMWPLVLTDGCEGERAATAIEALAERILLPRQQLAEVPKLPRRHMHRIELVPATESLRDWLQEREAWARVIGLLDELLHLDRAPRL